MVEGSNGWPCVLFWQLGPSPLRPPDIIHVMNAPRPFPFFARSSAPVYYCEANEGKTGEARAR